MQEREIEIERAKNSRLEALLKYGFTLKYLERSEIPPWYQIETVSMAARRSDQNIVNTVGAPRHCRESSSKNHRNTVFEPCQIKAE